jgi:predicted nucleic acid-binding protein
MVYATNSVSPWHRLAGDQLHELRGLGEVHDANIVATMQVYGVRHLLTHNTADFARFSHLITVVPLEPMP